jgi:hypothetical protein
MCPPHFKGRNFIFFLLTTLPVQNLFTCYLFTLIDIFINGYLLKIKIVKEVNKKSPFSRALYRGADLNCRPSGYESDALTS